MIYCACALGYNDPEADACFKLVSLTGYYWHSILNHSHN